MGNNNSHIRLSVLISVADVLMDLKRRGYRQMFRRDTTFLYSLDLYLWFIPEQFNVDESYHFEEVSSPDGDRVVYAISTDDGVKGILVDMYGVYVDNISPEMAQKLNVRKRHQINVYTDRILNIPCREEVVEEIISNAF